MVFSSNIFLLYFLPIFFICYFVTPIKYRNYPLLLFSVIFYSYGAPDFVLILLLATVLNFYIVKTMLKSGTEKKKKFLCGLSICVSLSLLLYYKYSNFFVENINTILNICNQSALSWRPVVLPIGISFFTFQSITYTVDMYRSTAKPNEKLTDYVLYIIMFPQLIAGPIVRYNTVAEELVSRKYVSKQQLAGVYRFVIGLSKKVLISNTLAKFADEAFSMDVADLSTPTAWLGMLSYTLQIYFDFSGYSDMAIGLGKIRGFHFPENFDNPYTSKSISEFWRRWHITLGAFMREYLYIPLGGNRVSKRRTYINLWIVFLLSGFWHGASYNFILWGAYHGFFLVLDRLCMLDVLKKIGSVPSVILTFLAVNIGWVLFRADDLSNAFGFYHALFNFSGTLQITLDGEYIFTLVVAVILSFITMVGFGKRLCDMLYSEVYTTKQSLSLFLVIVFLLILSVGSLSVSDFNPFIYFRF